MQNYKIPIKPGLVQVLQLLEKCWNSGNSEGNFKGTWKPLKKEKGLTNRKYSLKKIHKFWPFVCHEKDFNLKKIIKRSKLIYEKWHDDTMCDFCDRQFQNLRWKLYKNASNSKEYRTEHRYTSLTNIRVDDFTSGTQNQRVHHSS